jgi:protein phosphatase
VRDHNEDNYLADPDIGLWIIADGMGGHNAGEVASDIVIRSVARQMGQGRSLPEAVGRSHHDVIEESKKDKSKSGMGSTAVAMHVDGINYHIAWVGDSRAYLWDGGLKLLTHDHSYVQQLIDSGAITEKEALEHPEKSVISQALGAPDMPEVRVDTVTGQFYSGEKILLCSDGLNAELNDGLIATILAKGSGDRQIVDNLIQAANDAGGSDNVTVILVSAPSDAPVRIAKGATMPMDYRDLKKRYNRKQRQTRVIWGIVTAVLVACLLVISLFWLSQKETPRISTDSNRPVPIRLEKETTDKNIPAKKNTVGQEMGKSGSGSEKPVPPDPEKPDLLKEKD